MKINKYIIVLLSMVYCQTLLSQEGEYITVRDFETWSSLNLEYKVNKKWEIKLEEQLRLKDNSSQIDGYFTELSTSYDFNDHVFGGIGLRYIRQNDTEGNIQGFENHMRLNFDLGYKFKVNRFDIKSRLRFQTKNELGITKDQGDYANNHLRFKIDIDYNIKKWKLDPMFSSEIFRHYEQGEENGFDKFRFTIGTKYKIKGYGKIGAFYRLEKELNVSYPKTTNIVGLKYTYTIKGKTKPEKKIYY